MPASFETTDTRALYAVHGENTLDYDGWIIRTFGIGHDPTHHGGADMRGRHRVFARLNDGYPPTIPLPMLYEAFIWTASFWTNMGIVAQIYGMR